MCLRDGKDESSWSEGLPLELLMVSAVIAQDILWHHFAKPASTWCLCSVLGFRSFAQYKQQESDIPEHGWGLL